MNYADQQAARMESIARGLANARRAGLCSHENLQTELNPGAKIIGNYSPPTKCLDCGKVATWEELEEERQEILQEWT